MIDLAFLFILVLLGVGFYKKDFSTLILAGLGFIFTGLMTINSHVYSEPYNFQIGVLMIFYGVYIAMRSSLEIIKIPGENKWQQKQKKNLDVK